MTDYQMLFGDMVPPPPFRHDNVVLQGMFFEAGLQELTGYLKTTVGAIPGIEVEVVSSTLLLTTLYAESVRPTHRRYAARDGISEIDCGFWLLVRCGRAGGPQKLYWTPLCLFVDSGFALVIGRELYGFPKMLGQIGPPQPSASSDLSVAVRTDHFVTDDGHSKFVRNALLFGVRLAQASVAPEVEEVSASFLKAEMSQTLTATDALSAEALAVEASAPGIPYLHMPMLFLKQFRAISGTPSAAYAAVTAAHMVPDGLPRIERITNTQFELFLEDSDTLPLAEIFGLQSGAPARLPFRAALSFTAGEGEVI